MKAMASRSATRPGTAAWHPTKDVRVRGPVPAGLWLALAGVAALTLGAGLPAVAMATRGGLAALGLLLVAGSLVARRARGVVRGRSRSFRGSLSARHAAVVLVGGHRAGRDARRRVPSVWVGRAGGCRVRDRRVRPALPAGRHAWRDR